MSNRESLLNKIRHLMSKTTAAGCTEAEALEALAKARAMIDAYEVSPEELKLAKEEAAILRSEPAGTPDPHGIKRFLCTAVSHFCDCKCWRNTGGGLTFCGMQSDAQFATWLLDNLTGFVQAELVKHLMTSVATGSRREQAIEGFVWGCTDRISDRLNALCDRSKTKMTGSGRELVLTKAHAIDATMDKAGIKLKNRGKTIRRSIDQRSYAAGASAGDKASFGRPVSGANATLRLTSHAAP